jgi:O-antigen ligase
VQNVYFIKLGPALLGLSLFFALLAVDEPTSAFLVPAILAFGTYWLWGEATGDLSTHETLTKLERGLLVGGVAIFTLLVFASPMRGISLAKVWPFWLAFGAGWVLSRLRAQGTPYVLGWLGVPLGIFVLTGLAQWALGFQPKGFFNDNNLFAAACNAVMFVGLGAAFYYRETRTRWASLLLGGVLSIIAVSWEASSRSGWLALLVCTGASGLWVASKVNWPRWRVLFLTAVLLAIAAASTHEKNQQITLSNTNPQGYSSIDMRWAMLKSSWQMFKDHPTGVGLGLWRLAYPRYRSEVDVDSSGDHAHNDYAELLASGGVLGLAGLLIFPALCLAGAWRLRKSSLGSPDLLLAAGCFTGGLALAVGAGLNFVFFQPGMALLFGLLIGLGFSQLATREALTAPVKEPSLLRQTTTGGIVAVSLLLAAFQALSALSAAVVLYKTPGAERLLSGLADDRVLSMLNKFYPVDHRAPLALGFRRDQAAAKLRPSVKEMDYLLLVDDASAWYSLAENRARGYSPIPAFHGTLLLTAYGLDNPEMLQAGRKLLERALWLDPGDFTALHTLVSVEAAFGNFKKAEELLSRAQTATPSADRVRIDQLRIQLKQFQAEAMNPSSPATTTTP